MNGRAKVDWDKLELLFELISKLINQSKAEGRGEDTIRSSLSSPGTAEWWTLRIGLRHEGIRGRERREYMRLARDQARDMTNDRVDDLMDAAE